MKKSSKKAIPEMMLTIMQRENAVFKKPKGLFDGPVIKVDGLFVYCNNGLSVDKFFISEKDATTHLFDPKNVAPEHRDMYRVYTFDQWLDLVKDNSYPDKL